MQGDEGDRKRQDRKAYLVVAAVLLVGGALAVALTMWTGSGTGSSVGNDREAVAQCEGFADKRLKSPATAEYDLTASETDGAWTVTGTVDSQNGFGALVRSDVTCVLHFADDLAQLDDISIG